MNDTPIKSAIDATHSVIFTAALFIFTLAALLWIALTEGIALDTLRLHGVTVEKLYIKWDKRLHVTAGRIALEPSDNDADDINLTKSYRGVFSFLRTFNGSWIDSLCVNRLEAAGAVISLHYRPSKTSTLQFDTGWLQGRLRLGTLTDRTALTLDARIHRDTFKGHVTLNGTLDLLRQTLELAIEGNATGKLRIRGELVASAARCEANIYGSRPIESITALVEALHLHPDTEPWITSRAEGGALHLRTLRTAFALEHPEEALQNLRAELLFENVHYRFANHPEAFEPVYAPRVLLTFDNLTLNIHPIDALFYGISGRSTWLNIDFQGRDPILNLYLDIDDRLSTPLHELIASYGIHLPFTQASGKTATDLTLHVNLQTNKTSAYGNFLIRESLLDFSGLSAAVKRADVHLENSYVTIANGDASILDGKIRFGLTAAFDAAIPEGDINFHLTQAHLLASPQWELRHVPHTLIYRLAASGSSIISSQSQWRFADENYTLDAFNAPFDFQTLTLQLPATLLSQTEALKLLLQGRIGFDPLKADLACRLLHLSRADFSNSSPIPFRFRYDTKLRIDIPQDSFWNWNSRKLNLSPTRLDIDGNRLTFEPTIVDIKGLLKGEADGYVDLDKRIADITIGDFIFSNPVLGELFRKEQDFRVYALPEKNTTKIFIPSLKTFFATDGEGWQLDFSDIGVLTRDSHLMREYNVSTGKITAHSKDGGLPVTFEGEVDYPYAVAVEGKTPVHQYGFTGAVDGNGTITTTINQKIMLRIDDNISLKLSGVGLNQPEIMRFYREHRLDSNESNDSADTPAFTLDANATFIQLDGGRKALADRLRLHYNHNAMDAKLFHGKGGILFQAVGSKFYVYGRDLNDRFMENLMHLSHFKGGSLSFFIDGNASMFHGLVRIDKTRIYDYVVFNNLFAFFNTVPSLVTFRLPSYASEGIPIRSAYATLDYHDEVMNVTGINVDSDELDFSGEGLLNYRQNRIDMNLSIKTQLGENLRKIPVVGYILVGTDNSVLTTVQIRGSMNDPKISSALARDIIVTPFHIIKRTFDFPLHYLNKLEEGAPQSAPKPKPKKSAHEITSGVPSAH